MGNYTFNISHVRECHSENETGVDIMAAKFTSISKTHYLNFFKLGPTETEE